MIKTLLKLGILGTVVFLGLALAIPSSLSSLVLSGIAAVGLVAVIVGSILR